MRNKIRLAILLFFFIVLSIVLHYKNKDSDTVEASQNNATATSTVSKITNIFKPEEPKTLVRLDVPYISEAPEGNWSGNWVNACEEATISMAAKFYAGDKEVSIANAKATLQKLFDIENKIYGNNRNTDAKQMLKLITDYSTFSATIKQNPTVDEIKDEIIAGHPVISLHRGFGLGNKNIPFLATGSSYHTIIVIGFDDVKKEFITHDPGDDKDGVGHRYDYDVFMNSLHNYDFSDNQADGVPTVLFTEPKK
ncbi:MAG: C39 family peptidase [Patescibacteria group bacterium]